MNYWGKYSLPLIHKYIGYSPIMLGSKWQKLESGNPNGGVQKYTRLQRTEYVRAKGYSIFFL